MDIKLFSFVFIFFMAGLIFPARLEDTRKVDRIWSFIGSPLLFILAVFYAPYDIPIGILRQLELPEALITWKAAALLVFVSGLLIALLGHVTMSGLIWLGDAFDRYLANKMERDLERFENRYK